MTHRQEILGAVYNCPQSIPSLFKVYNKQLLNQILYGLLPRRIGIEIECNGCITTGKKFIDLLKSHHPHTLNNVLSSYYKVKEIKIDSFYVNVTEEEISYILLTLNEHRISILGYKQLVGLYKFLEDMKENCCYNESGIHIHIDAKDIYSSYSIKTIQKSLYKYLNSVEPIFGKYNGSYNDKSIEIRSNSHFEGHGWITLNTNYKTIEFRTAPMTFDYSTIVKWCIHCSSIINQVKKELTLKHSKDVDGS